MLRRAPVEVLPDDLPGKVGVTADCDVLQANASEAQGKLLPRQLHRHAYNAALIRRFRHLPDIRRIERHRHLPAALYKASRVLHTP